MVVAVSGGNDGGHVTMASSHLAVFFTFFAVSVKP